MSAEAQAANITWTGAGATNNWSDAANWSAGVPGSADVAIFDATSTKNVLVNANANVLGLAINAGYSGTMTQGAGFTITAGTSNFSQTSGDFVGGNSSITCTGAFDLSGGTFTSTSATLTVRGNFTHTTGGVFLHNSGTVSLSTNAAAIDVATSETFFHLTFTSGTKTIAAGDTLAVDETLTLTDGFIDTGSVEAHADIAQASTFDGGTGSLIINGTGNQTFTGTATASNGTLPFLIINKATGTLTLAGTIRTASNWTYTAGTLDPGTSLVVFAISGSGNTQTITGAQTLTDVQITASGHKAISSSLTVTGTLTLSDGFIDTGTVNVTGAVTQASAFDGGNANFIINGAGAQTFTGSATASAGDLPPVTINKPGGTLTLAGTIRTASNWTYTAGTLDPGTSLVVFAISGSGNTQTITGAQTLTDVQITASGHKAISSSLTVTGTLTLSDGFIDTGTVNVTGAVTQASAFDGGNANFIINGAGAQTFTGSATASAGSLPPVTINKPGGTLTLAGTIRTASNWTYTAGTLDAGTSNVVFAGTLTITGSHSLNDVDINGGTHATIAAGTHLTVNGILLLTNGFIDTGTVDAEGNITQLSGFDGGTGLILINGTGNQTFTGGGSSSSGTLPPIEINKPSGTLTLSSTIRTTSHWTYTAGTLDAGTSNVVFAGTLTITGSHSLNDVDVNSSNHKTIAAGTHLTVNGILLLTNGFIDTGTVDAKGSITQVSGFDGGTGLILINGTGNQTFTGGGSSSSGTLPPIEINKPSGTLTLSSTIRTTSHWTYTAGTLDAGTSNVVFAGTLTITGSHALNDVELTTSSHKTIAAGTDLTVNGTTVLTNGYLDSGTLDAQGNITQVTGFDGGTGLILINGTGNQTFTGGGSVTAGSLPNININKLSGSLSLSSIIRTGGNWIYTAGAVSVTPSTVVFAGTATQTVGGTVPTTFDNVTVDNGSGVALLPGPVDVGGILTFTNGTITTGASKVIIDPAGTVVRVSGHVNGNLQKNVIPGAAVTPVFEVGDASNYLPVTLLFGNVTGAGNLTVGMAPGNHPDIVNSGLEVARTIPRYWTITNGGATFDTCSATLEFATTDIPMGADASRFIVAKKDASWTTPTIAAKGPALIQTSGMTSFSDFVVGEAITGATTLSLRSGNNQIGVLNTVLGSPLVVTVTDAAGSSVSAINVTFTIASFPAGAVGQSLSVTSAVTDTHGQAATTLTLGSRTGPYTVTATSTGLSGSPVSFDCTAVDLIPLPVITGFLPEHVIAGTRGLRLIVVGSNFVSGSIVRWNNSDRSTSYASSNQLTVGVLDSDIVNPGSVSITVFSPAPGGGLSTPRLLAIQPPPPVITQLDPASITAGSAEITLTVHGDRFVAGSIVRWNGSDRPTTYVSSRQLSARIPSSDLAKAGSALITVLNTDAGVSNKHVLAITDLHGVISLTLSPSSPAAGETATGTLTLNSPAPIGGITIRLSSSDVSSAMLPETLVIPTGASSAIFEIRTRRVEKVVLVAISGSYKEVTLTANLVLGKAVAPASSTTLFVPIVLSTAGINNSFYTTELTLANRGGATAVVDFSYVAALGTGGGSASDIVAAGQQRILPDAIAYLRSIGIPIGTSGNRGGTLKVRFTGISDPSTVMVTARTTTLDPNGRAGLAYSGLPVSGLLSGPAYLCGLRQNAVDRTNVALQNAGEPSDGNILLRLTVLSGDPLAASSVTLPEVELGPGEFYQINGVLATNGLDLASGYVRVERVQGSAPYYAYAVINDQVTSDGSFVPPHPRDSLKPTSGVTIPVILKNSGFQSELVLTNLSDASKTLLLDYVADTVWTADSVASFSLELKPGQQLHYPDVVNALRDSGVSGIGPGGIDYVGALFVRAVEGDISGVFVGARTSTSGALRYCLSYAGVPFGRAAIETVWIYGLQQNDQNRTNLALVNTGETGNESDVFQLELFDGDTVRSVSTTQEIGVEARRWIQIGSVINRYAPGTQNAYVRVTKTAGSNPFIAYAVINDGDRPGSRTGDGAFLTFHAEPSPSSVSTK